MATALKAVTGFGGVCVSSRDPAALGDWYRQHLGLPVQPWGGAVFSWREADDPCTLGRTMWTPMPADDPSVSAGVMLNFRVGDLAGLVADLRASGCEVEPGVEASEYGQFAWLRDPEGRRIELWQPPVAPPTPLPAMVIATADLVWISRDGRVQPLEIRVHAPAPAEGGGWACAVQTAGLGGNYPPIHGETSLQALALALRLVATRLGHLLEQGEHLAYAAAPGDRLEAADLAALFGLAD